jgi:hypothetical protein
MSAHVAVPRLPTPDPCAHEVNTPCSNQLEAVGILYEESAYTSCPTWLDAKSTACFRRSHALPLRQKPIGFNSRLYEHASARV